MTTTFSSFCSQFLQWVEFLSEDTLFPVPASFSRRSRQGDRTFFILQNNNKFPVGATGHQVFSSSSDRSSNFLLLLLDLLLIRLTNPIYLNPLPRTGLSVSFCDNLYFVSPLVDIQVLILVVSRLSSYRYLLPNSSGTCQFILLCSALSIVPLYRNFFDCLILYILVIALKSNLCCLHKLLSSII
jgi:hypothetical protein